MAQKDGVRIETVGLSQEQEHLLIIYAWAYHYYEGIPFWHELAEWVHHQLVKTGIHPCYDEEDDVYTYIKG